MPEGHTIHRLAADLRRSLGSEPVTATSPQGRFDDAHVVDGHPVERADAYGKHLFVRFEPATVHIHLGLIGKMRPTVANTAPTDTVRLRLEAGDVAWHLTGPQTCRLVDGSEIARIVDDLGPDPLRRGASATDMAGALSQRRAPIGATLLDQSVVAGIGNVYRAELLFLAGIDPRRPSSSLTEDEGVDLFASARDLLRLGKRLDRIVTVTGDDARTTPGRLRDDERLYVYKRGGEPCRRCGTEIATGDVGGRTTWWCPRCQS